LGLLGALSKAKSFPRCSWRPIIITKRGTPVAKVVPVTSKKQDLFGFMAGELKIVGDIESPVVPLDEWR
jgi:antitoxin (DNA-binding transcriptional repressor) of toxin-antitoxin stability system